METRVQVKKYSILVAHISLYIHMPFCRSKCHYCDFYSLTNCGSAVIADYIDALAHEWNSRWADSEAVITTLYIGGGTPSLLSPQLWDQLNRKLLVALSLDKNYEWTVECNPESLTAEKLNQLRSMGINRLSIGIQSLIDRELRLLNRPHTSCQVEKLFADTPLDQFLSVSADVMYKLPAQDGSSFRKTLEFLLSQRNVTHVSAYELTVADATPIGRHRRCIPFPSDDTVNQCLTVLHKETEAAGMKQYEVSNFAQPGFECSHNIRYWRHEPYIGLGCAAHSYLHPKRFWNSSDLSHYLNDVRNGCVDKSKEEILDNDALAREIVFLGLRQSRGLSEIRFEELTGMEFGKWVDTSTLEKLLDKRWLIHDFPFYLPTRDSIYFADMMARDLIPW